MANISSFLNTIKTAIYGRDMRQSLHDAIEAVNYGLETEVNDRKSDVSGEASARQVADTALGQRIDTEAAAREASIINFGGIWFDTDEMYDAANKPKTRPQAGAVFAFRLAPSGLHMGVYTAKVPEGKTFEFLAFGDDRSSGLMINVSVTDAWKANTVYIAPAGYAGDGKVTPVVEAGYDILAHIDAADTALREDVTELQGKSHTHVNKSTLDNLTQTVITNSHTHVNKTLLDGITSADIARWNENGEVPTWYRAEVDRRINEIIEALGINVYDGGYFGDETVRKTLDGGLFDDDTPGRTVDGGDFGPLKFDIGDGAGLSDRVSAIEETLSAAEVANVTLADEAAIDAIFNE